MNIGTRAAERLKSVLLQDQLNAYTGFEKSLADDMKQLLGCYMALEHTPEVKLEAAARGEYKLTVTAYAANIKAPKNA